MSRDITIRPSWLVLMGALGVGLALAGCSKPAPPANTDQPLSVTVTAVQESSMSAGLSASGVLVSREEAGVASELSGYRVAQVFVDEGAWVKKGQPLARLDDTLLRSQIDQQNANVAQQKVAGQRAQAEADRVKGLDNQGILSQEQISERRLAAKSADAQVASAEAGLNDLKTREGLMVIRAPVTGRVLERTARPGDTSAPGTTLFRIARDGLVEMDAQAPESDLTEVKVGDRARVELPTGVAVTGQVRFISPRVDPQTKLGDVRIALPMRGDLRPGGYARAVFQGGAANAKVLPEQGVHFDANGAYVMTVGADSRVRRVDVTTGRRSNGLVEILGGLPVGTRVALGGGVFLLDGDKINAVTAPQPSAASSGSAR
jgi:HlyD family secretion protein